MGKIYVIGSQKGGVGKTTSTLNLAYALQKQGKKVLAVDFDSQANLTACYGIENTGETNMIQRSFSELLPSEKAAVLAVRYEKISSQDKRNDILQEIAALNGREGTCGHDVHKSRSRDELGNEYGMTGRNIARYMRVDKLIPEFKEELDNGALSLVAAVDLSYLSEKEQKAVVTMVSEDKVKLNPKNAAAIRAESGNITQKSIRKIADSAARQKKKDAVSIKLSMTVYQKYFADRKAKEATDIVEKALEAWFRKEEADIVQ